VRVLDQFEHKLLSNKIYADTRRNLSDGDRSFQEQADLERKVLFSSRNRLFIYWVDRSQRADD
jgi:hypothetical protein